MPRTQMSRGITIHILSIDIRSPLNQDPSNVELTSVTSNVKRCSPIRSSSIDISIKLKKNLSNLKIALWSSQMQSSPIVTSLNIRINSLSIEQLPNTIGIATLCSFPISSTYLLLILVLLHISAIASFLMSHLSLLLGICTLKYWSLVALMVVTCCYLLGRTLSVHEACWTPSVLESCFQVRTGRMRSFGVHSFRSLLLLLPLSDHLRVLGSKSVVLARGGESIELLDLRNRDVLYLHNWVCMNYS